MTCLAAALDVLAWRAMERAGNRLTTRHLRGVLQEVAPSVRHTLVVVEPDDLERLLADAWLPVPHLVEQYGEGVRPEILEVVLDEYARGLLTCQVPHSRQRLEEALRSARIGA